MHVFQVLHDELQYSDVASLSSTMEHTQTILTHTHTTIRTIRYKFKINFKVSSREAALTLFSQLSLAPQETRICRIFRWPNQDARSRAFMPNCGQIFRMSFSDKMKMRAPIYGVE